LNLGLISLFDNFTKKECLSFSTTLRKLNQLEKLELDYQHCSFTEGLHLFEDSLRLMKKLMTLKLNFNYVTLEKNSFISVLTNISFLSQLKNLELSFSSFYSNFVIAKLLSQCLEKLVHLSKFSLNLEKCNIGFTGVCLLFDKITRLTNLESLKLNLSGNGLGVGSFKKIICAVTGFHLKSLDLNLSNNWIINSFEDILSEKISEMNKIKNLQIDLTSNLIENIRKSDSFPIKSKIKF
jgi:hypothetical protein